MRLIITLSLVVLLTGERLPAQQATDSAIKQQISEIPSTTPIEVRMLSGERVRGHIVNRGESEFSLERDKGAGMQTVAYSQVASVSQVKVRHSHKKWSLSAWWLELSWCWALSLLTQPATHRSEVARVLDSR